MIAALEADQAPLFESAPADAAAGVDVNFEVDPASVAAMESAQLADYRDEWLAWFRDASDAERRAAWDQLEPTYQLELSTVSPVAEWLYPSGSESPDGDYAWVANEGDVTLYPVQELQMVQQSLPADQWALALSKVRPYEFLAAGTLPGLPREGVGTLTLSYGAVASWDYAVAAAGPAVDWGAIRRRNLEVLNAMVARDSDDEVRTQPIMQGENQILLGDGHPFAAIRQLGGPVGDGRVRFHRNRTSANELRIQGGEFDLEVLERELRSLLADPACSYPYRDRDRVVIH
jgi:hypothetical protein